MKIQIPDFNNTHVLVVGDLMLDRYWQGPTSRISPEAPVPVVRIEQLENRPGGAGNVAVNITSLGASALVDGFVGQDEAGKLLETSLKQLGVQCCFKLLSDVKTIVKLRVISQHQQLIRLDFEDSFIIQQYQELLKRYSQNIKSADVIVLSDYAKGTLGNVQELKDNPVPELIRLACEVEKPVLVDPKGTDFQAYHGATLLTPNYKEFETVVGYCRNDEEIATKGESLRKDLELEALLITRSDRGMTLLQQGHPVLHLPVKAREVYDVTGAGDTVIAVLASAMAAGESIESAASLANLAAGIVVGKLGAASVTIDDLSLAASNTNSDKSHTSKILDHDELIKQVESNSSKGQRIVMTNGCFDILHAGHVAYLSQARKMGDRLIVAVNDDQSVTRLKGQGRPINSLQHRMTVLAALESVDWVVAFSEQTPERIICRVLPDFLVKGGDYQVSEIAGNQCVTDNGGEVVILAYQEGCSSSGIIESIREL